MDKPVLNLLKLYILLLKSNNLRKNIKNCENSK